MVNGHSQSLKKKRRYDMEMNTLKYSLIQIETQFCYTIFIFILLFKVLRLCSSFKYEIFKSYIEM